MLLETIAGIVKCVFALFPLIKHSGLGALLSLAIEFLLYPLHAVRVFLHTPHAAGAYVVLADCIMNYAVIMKLL